MGSEAGTKDVRQKLCKGMTGREIFVLQGQTAHISCLSILRLARKKIT
jgi:hypothetical protein